MTQEELKLKFRERLVTILQERNMSKYRLAKLSGLSTSRISDYINMKTTPTIFAVINIAHALGLSEDELMNLDE